MNSEIKQPLKNKIAKVPVTMQLETIECGAASLCMVLSYYDKWIPLEEMRIDCGISRDGSKASNIIKAAKKYGLNGEGYQYNAKELKENGRFPCIIYWKHSHFLVLNGFGKNYVSINDPARGNIKITYEEFNRDYSNVVLFFTPDDNFAPSGKPKSLINFIKNRLHGLKESITFVTIITLVISLLGIISLIFERIFYDRLLTNQNPEWENPFLISLGIVYLLMIVMNIISYVSNLVINGKIALKGVSAFMWKILHLPMQFFSQRLSGDILSRQDDNTDVANTLINTLSPLVLNTLMMIMYLVIMIRYSWILTFIGVSTVIINIFLSQYIAAKKINLTRVILRDSGNLYGNTVSGLQMMETIKSSGAEEGYFSAWAGNYASTHAREQEFAKKNYTLNLIPTMITSLSGMLILGIGVYFIMQNQFTLGMLTAFQGFYTSFSEPAQSLIESGSTIQEMRSKMERIDDVMEYQEDPHSTQNDIISHDNNLQKLSGNIEIKDLTFGYSPLEKPLIENFNISIKSGSHIAFVGASGCGKSTLSKLITGLYEPWSGSITFDGKKIGEIDHSVFVGSLALVDQEITLFQDTFTNNIKMLDDTIEDFEVIMASRDAQIHNDIIAREKGYNFELKEGGKDLSGGQRQRIEIARVLALDPTIVILDEATSALDAQTEYNVVKSIKERGVTCITIAHRLSTIKDADEIVVLDKGKVVERGRHEELMKLGGVYTNLITKE